MLSALLNVAGYAVACNLPTPALSRFIPAATFSMFIVALKIGMSNSVSFCMAFIPAAVALHLYTGKYSGTPNLSPQQIQDSIKAGMTPEQLSKSGDLAPPMVVEYLYYPALAGVSTLFLGTVLNSVGIPLIPSSEDVGAVGVVSSAVVMTAHFARCVSFVAERLIYPAPIVAQFLIGEKALATYRAPIAHHVRKIAVHKEIGNANSALLGEVEYAVMPQQTMGRNLATGAPVLTKQWVMYLGGNGEVFEASYPSAIEIARSLNANLLVFNPRGVGRSTGNIFYASDLVLDATTVIRQVVKEYNLSPDGRNMLLIGHSIGGGIAAELAASVLPEASVVFDRTFSTLSDASNALSPIRNEKLVRTLMPYIFGDFDVIGNYKKIRHNRKLVIYHRDDQIIHFNAVSLGRVGAEALGGQNYILELQGRNQDNHNCGFDKFSNHQVVLKRITAIV